MAVLMLSNVKIAEDILNDRKYQYLFTVEAVNELVNKGIPFREAYKQVGNDVNSGKFTFDYSKGLNHSHEGSIGNLCNDKIAAEMTRVLAKFE